MPLFYLHYSSFHYSICPPPGLNYNSFRIEFIPLLNVDSLCKLESGFHLEMILGMKSTLFYCCRNKDCLQNGKINSRTYIKCARAKFGKKIRWSPGTYGT